MNLLVLQCRVSATLSNNTPALAKIQHGHEYEQNGPLRLPPVTWDSPRHGCQCCCQRAIPNPSRDGSDAMRTRAEHTAAAARNVKQEQHTDTHHIPGSIAGENPAAMAAQTAAACRDQHPRDATIDNTSMVYRDSAVRGQDAINAVSDRPVSQVSSEAVTKKLGKVEICGMGKMTDPGVSVGVSGTDADKSRRNSHPASPLASDPLPTPTRLPPSQPAPFTNMLDVDEPRYFPPASATAGLSPSLDGKERNFCRTVIISNLPCSVSTISAVLRRVRGGMVIRAGIVDMSAWPTAFQSSVTTDAVSSNGSSDLAYGHCFPSGRTAQIEFADPREAAAYVAHVNDATQVVDKDALFGIRCCLPCRPVNGCLVRVQLAGTPSYPLPAHLHRMIQTEGATRCVVVRYQVSSTTYSAPSSHDDNTNTDNTDNTNYDDNDGNDDSSVREPEKLAQAAVNVAAGEVVGKSMALLERRFLSTWPYRAAGSGQQQQQRSERYALLEDAWVEQDFSPIRANDGVSLGDISGRDGDEDESGRITPSDPHEQRKTAACTGLDNNNMTPKSTKTKTNTTSTTVHLHLNFCKIEHAIRAASALRYQIGPPRVRDTTTRTMMSAGGSSSEASVAVGFARDACAGDFEELQDDVAITAPASASVLGSALPLSPLSAAIATATAQAVADNQKEAQTHDTRGNEPQDTKVNILDAWKDGNLAQLLGEIFPGYPSQQGHVDSPGISTSSTSSAPGIETRKDMEDLLDLTAEIKSGPPAEQNSGGSSPASSQSPSFWSTFAPVSPTDTEFSVQSSTSDKSGVKEELKTRGVVVDGADKVEFIDDGSRDHLSLL